MQTRSISYVDSEEDSLEFEVQEALKRPLADNLSAYFKAVASQCAMMGVDIKNPPNTRKIYFIEE